MSLTTYAVKGSRLTIAEMDENFNWLNANKLSTATAAATYLTIALAASTYLTPAAAASTYLTQANAASTYQPLSANLSAVALYVPGIFGLNLLTSVNSSDARTYLGLGSMALQDSSAVAITGGTISIPTFTSTVATGTAPFTVASTTLVPNLYVARAVLADSATTNANLTGPITSVGNATAIASQTGTGTTFVMSNSPTLVTPILGVATATSISAAFNGSIGATTPSTGAFTTISASGTSSLTGVVGIGVAPSANAFLYIRGGSAHTSSGTSNYGVFVDYEAPNTASAHISSYFSRLRTVASAWTAASLVHFVANDTMKGSGSTITSVYGFSALNAIAVGANNYGFYSDINAASSTYQLYMGGSAASFFGGSLGIGSIATANTFVRVTADTLTATIVSAVYNSTTFPSTVVTLGRGFVSDMATANAAFTLATMNHFEAYSTTKGAASTLTSVRGFYAANAIAAGTNNYAFYTDFASAANKWAFYSAGTADSAFAGNVRIGSTTAPTNALSVTGSAGFNATATAAFSAIFGQSSAATAGSTYLLGFVGTSLSSATAAFGGVSSQLATAASTAVTNVFHFIASSLTINSGGSVTSATGFRADSGLGTGASQVYGFRGSLAAAANTYNVYMDGTASNYFGGALGVYLAPAPTITPFTSAFGAAQTSASIYGNWFNGTGPTTATGTVGGFIVNLTSSPSAYTVASMTGFYAATFTKGASSTITSAIGFLADNGLAVGTNNFGFYSNISAASNTYQLYMGGTALNYLNGELGVKTTPLTTAAITLARPTSTGTDLYGVYGGIVGPSTATASVQGMQAVMSTTATAYTLTALIGFNANSWVKGAGSTITACYGFIAGSGMAVGTSNYGFYASLNSGSTYAFYAAGSAPSYFAGNVGIGGSLTLATAQLYITRGQATGTTQQGVYVNYTADNTSTSGITGFVSVLLSAASAYTVTNMKHFEANAGAAGGGSTITNVYGFSALNAIAVGSFNYGFHSSISNASNTYQMYLAGTAPSQINGYISFNCSVNSAVLLYVNGGAAHSSSSTGLYGIASDFTVPSTGTATTVNYYSVLRTAATAFTSAQIVHYYANQTIKGAGSTITSMVGFWAANACATGSFNYGFYSDFAAAANNWALYMGGTAQSYFGGEVGIGSAASSSTQLALAASTTAKSSLRVIHGAAPTTPVDGDIWTTTAGMFIRVNGVTKTVTLT